MDTTAGKPPQVIGYANLKGARPTREQPPSPILVTALCLPGLVCWCALLYQFVPRSLRPHGPFLRLDTLLLCWAVAVLTALASLAIYWRGRKTWYVWLNFAINIAGLLFTGAIFLLIVAA